MGASVALVSEEPDVALLGFLVSFSSSASESDEEEEPDELLESLLDDDAFFLLFLTACFLVFFAFFAGAASESLSEDEDDESEEELEDELEDELDEDEDEEEEEDEEAAFFAFLMVLLFFVEGALESLSELLLESLEPEDELSEALELPDSGKGTFAGAESESLSDSLEDEESEDAEPDEEAVVFFILSDLTFFVICAASFADSGSESELDDAELELDDGAGPFFFDCAAFGSGSKSLSLLESLSDSLDSLAEEVSTSTSIGSVASCFSEPSLSCHVLNSSARLGVPLAASLYEVVFSSASNSLAASV